MPTTKKVKVVKVKFKKRFKRNITNRDLKEFFAVIFCIKNTHMCIQRKMWTITRYHFPFLF